MRSMVEWESQMSAGLGADGSDFAGDSANSGVSLTTTLRVVPLSQNGSGHPRWIRSHRLPLMSSNTATVP